MSSLFRSFDKAKSFPELEREILDKWDQDQPFKESIEQRDEKDSFVFYDGPPFATGLPHYGHLLAGTIKDIVPRYWSMKGKHIPRRFGWDCHGLPIESLIQNELGLSGVGDIISHGIDNFNEACRSSVLKYTSEWEQTVRRMGRWVDFQDDYKTMDKSFMESVWWVFQQCWEKGLIYQGYRIQPYSPALATPLSNFETNQGYKDRQDPSLTIRLPLLDDSGEVSDESLIVWTTTPWTLPSNMATAVGPEIDYVLVESDVEGAGNVWLAESRIASYFKEAPEFLKRAKGSELAGRRYQPLFDYMTQAQGDTEEHKNRFQILTADFVSTENGTGIVHIAPSFGEDDFILGEDNNLGLFDPLDSDGKFTSTVADWEGLGAKEADKSIMKAIKDAGHIYRQETLNHSYPHCYRTGVPLLYRAVKTWFLTLEEEITNPEGVTKTLKQWMIDNNQEINWVPGHIRDGRFGKWLENARDWNLSRNRFWGTPLPIWIAEDGDMICIGSEAELAALTGQPVEDLHMHIVDKLEVRTSDGKTFDPAGKAYARTPEVFDCWFESGSMPYAQNHYPFENKEKVEANFPADFIAEGLDQTRGWFYTLTILSSALFQKPAFKNVIVNGIILAEDGNKMSKSLRNYPDPNLLIERTGADAIRLFMINSAAVKGSELKFAEEGVREIVKSVLLPLWNSLSLLVDYANLDASKDQLSWRPGQHIESDVELDRWILAVQQELLVKIQEEMEAFRLYNVVPAIVEFIDSLTNWYIRRSKERFWKSSNDDDKNQAYSTLYEVMVTLSQVLAPFLPFFAEEMYQILVREVEGPDSQVSVHLTDFPVADSSLQDSELVHQMELVRELINMGRSLRAKNELKTRQPLQSLSVVVRKQEDRDLIERMQSLVLDELNIKELIFAEEEADLVVLSAKANFKLLGKRFGKGMKTAAGEIAQLGVDAIAKLQAGEKVTLSMGDIELDEILIQRDVKEGVVVDASELFTIAIDTQITEELELECLARELVNRIQTTRKSQKFDVSDQIEVTLYTESAKVKAAIKAHLDYVTRETQTKRFVQAIPNGRDGEIIESQLNEEEIQFNVLLHGVLSH